MPCQPLEKPFLALSSQQNKAFIGSEYFICRQLIVFGKHKWPLYQRDQSDNIFVFILIQPALLSNLNLSVLIFFFSLENSVNYPIVEKVAAHYFFLGFYIFYFYNIKENLDFLNRKTLISLFLYLYSVLLPSEHDTFSTFRLGD